MLAWKVELVELKASKAREPILPLGNRVWGETFLAVASPRKLKEIEANEYRQHAGGKCGIIRRASIIGLRVQLVPFELRSLQRVYCVRTHFRPSLP